MKINKSHFKYLEQVLIFILVILLLLFGTSFSKFHIYGPLYLHDLLLVLCAVISLHRIKLKYPYKSFFWVAAFGVFYLLYSIIRGNEWSHIIRQSAIFLYPLIFYFIFNKIKSNNTANIQFIKAISIVAVVIQTIYVILINTGIVSINKLYSYYSPLAIMGIITFSAYYITYAQSSIKKILYALLAFLMSLTLGHSSAVLAILMVIAAYIYVKTVAAQKVVIVSFVGLCIFLLLIFNSEYSDGNATWRLVYWKMTLERVFFDNYGFGAAFGVPYVTSENINDFIAIFGNDNGFLTIPDEIYKKPMHNSFMTFLFHLGIIPLLLLLKPYYTFFRSTNNSSDMPTESIFLGLSLIGCSIWASFNVVLELPHSAIYFWLIYFSLCQKLYGK